MLNFKRCALLVSLILALQAGCVTRTVLRADKIYKSESDANLAAKNDNRIEAETCSRWFIFLGGLLHGSLENSTRELMKNEKRNCFKNIVFSESLAFYLFYNTHCYAVSADKEPC
jgi:hypothetical protein